MGRWASAVRRRSRSDREKSGRSHPGTGARVARSAIYKLRPDDLGPVTFEADRHRLELQRYAEDAVRLIERHHDGVEELVRASVRVHLGVRTPVESDEGWLERTHPPVREGFEWKRKRVAGEQIGASLYELPPGQRTFP